MIEVFKGAGILIYPLGICSAGAVFIICERAYALRKAAVMRRGPAIWRAEKCCRGTGLPISWTPAAHF